MKYCPSLENPHFLPRQDLHRCIVSTLNDMARYCNRVCKQEFQITFRELLEMDAATYKKMQSEPTVLFFDKVNFYYNIFMSHHYNVMRKHFINSL